MTREAPKGDTTGLRAKEVFLAALDEAEAERAGFVARACAGAPELRARVEKLLGAHERAAALDDLLAERALRRTAAATGRDEEPSPRFGDYEILDEIASGAMGTVYRARQTSLGRLVALKMLRVGRFASDSEVRRFRAEAEAVARLDHPSIVPVYEVGEHEGRHFFSMKLVDGPSLAAEGERLRRDPRAAARLVATVARAVHHAHLHGVLHRDLKPSNILLDAGGAPYVADFGVAKRVGAGVDETATGWVLGTPAYMAPEQATAGGDVTVASDVYSLGCVLYWLLAGRPPFEGASILDVLRKLREEEPPRLRGLAVARGRDLETICMRALAKEPARRYGSALALARDLERWLDNLPIEARPATRLERLRLLFRRKPVTTSLAVAVIALLVLSAAGATGASLMLHDRLQRAELAETHANERLRASLLAQARATRRGQQPGRRAEALDLLRQAATIAPGADLRDEAITCLSLTDLAVQAEWRRPNVDAPLIGADAELERLVESQADGSLVLRSSTDGTVVGRLGPLGPQAWYACFDPSGRLLAAKFHLPNSQSGAHYALWDLEAGELLFDAHVLVYSDALEFDPTGRWLAAGIGAGVALHDLRAPGAEPRLLPTEAAVTAVRFAPDGSLLAVGLLDERTVRLLSLPEGSVAAELPELPARSTGLCWSPDGSLLAVGCFDFRTHVFRYPSLDEVLVLSGHQAEVTGVLVAPGGLAATYSWDETTRLWDLDTGEELCVADARARGFSRDGRRLAFSTNDSAGLWRVERGGVFRVLHGHTGKSPTCVAADPAGRWLASGGMDGVWLRELGSGRPLGVLAAGVVESVFFAPDGGALYSSGEHGLYRWELPAAALDPSGTRPRALLEGVCGRAASSADGRTIAAVKGGGVRVLFGDDPGSGRSLRGPRGMDSPAVSPDGARVATGSWRGGGVHVWDAATGELERTLVPEATTVLPAFSPDGRWLVAGLPEEYRVWRVDDWSLERVLPRPMRLGNLPGAIAFEPATGALAVAIRQRVVQLFDAVGGEPRATLAAADAQSVSDLCFLPGGGLALATPTRRLQIWRLDLVDAELERWGVR